MLSLGSVFPRSIRLISSMLSPVSQAISNWFLDFCFRYALIRMANASVSGIFSTPFDKSYPKEVDYATYRSTDFQICPRPTPRPKAKAGQAYWHRLPCPNPSDSCLGPVLPARPYNPGLLQPCPGPAAGAAAAYRVIIMQLVFKYYCSFCVLSSVFAKKRRHFPRNAAALFSYVITA